MSETVEPKVIAEKWNGRTWEEMKEYVDLIPEDPIQSCHRRIADLEAKVSALENKLSNSK
jgi:polyhydroxyalkanoate synthesis regulator phasin